MLYESNNTTHDQQVGTVYRFAVAQVGQMSGGFGFGGGCGAAPGDFGCGGGAFGAAPADSWTGAQGGYGCGDMICYDLL